jgi:PAS domain S-box-containing protein
VIGVAVACILPMLGLSLFATWRLLDSQHEADQVQLMGTARALSAAVDLKLQKAFAALSALGTSPALERGDVTEFFAQSASVAAEHKAWILLFDANGHEIFNTRFPLSRGAGDVAEFRALALQVLQTGERRVSDISSRLRVKSFAVTTGLPVQTAGGVRYVLAMRFGVEELGAIFVEQGLPETWTATVADRNARILARNRALNEVAGRQLTEPARHWLQQPESREAAFEAKTQEGTPTLTAITKSSFSGWTTLVGIPLSEINAPRTRFLWEIGLATMILLIVVSAFARVLGRRMEQALQSLSQSALALAHGKKPLPIRSSISEYHDLAAAQEAAAVLLQQRENERDASEERALRQAALLQDAVDALGDGFVLYDAADRVVMTNQRFFEMRSNRDAYRPGTHFSDVLRAGIACGEIPIPKEGIEPWIQRRLMERRTPGEPMIMKRNGRWYRLSERRTRDGGLVAIQSDINELHQAQLEVEAARQRMADWAEAATDWFWETGPDHKFTFLSDGFEKATGINAAAMIGRPAEARRLHGVDDAIQRRHAEDLAAHRPFRDLLAEGQTKRGRKYYVSISGKPVFDADGVFLGYRGTGCDVTSQVVVEQALARQTQLFSTLIENLPIGVSLVGPDLQLKAVNPSFLQIFDLTPDMLQAGDPFAKFIRYNVERGEYGDVDVESTVQRIVDRAFEPMEQQFERMRPNGRTVEIRRVHLPDGGFVTTYIDVTDARRREADLKDVRHALEQQAIEIDAALSEAERARNAADTANAAKSLFLANMSHELRTPLNAILGFSEVLGTGLMGALNDRYRGYASDIHNSGQYLLRLINDMLDQSKLDISRFDLEENTFELRGLAEECQRLLTDKAIEGKVDVSMAMPPGLPAVRADRLRIKQILLNLLSNAIKFTPHAGRIVIAAEVEAGGNLAISVTDNGIGMRPEDIPIALQAFRQVDQSYTRRYEGTGLGLSIAKGLTELHGGTLEVQSALGRGTTVRVRLPRERVIQDPARLAG